MENKKITVKKILEICSGKLILGDENTEIISYSKDTRTINKGDLYLGIRGENTNGNLYVENALENGAIGCIVDDEIDENILKKYSNKVIIKVENTIKAIQQLAKYKRSLYDIPVIAITGSVRKNKHKRYGCKCSYDII